MADAHSASKSAAEHLQTCLGCGHIFDMAFRLKRHLEDVKVLHRRMDAEWLAQNHERCKKFLRRQEFGSVRARFPERRGIRFNALHCKQQFACAKHPAGAALPHMGRPALVVEGTAENVTGATEHTNS